MYNFRYLLNYYETSNIVKHWQIWRHIRQITVITIRWTVEITLRNRTAHRDQERKQIHYVLQQRCCRNLVQWRATNLSELIVFLAKIRYIFYFNRRVIERCYCMNQRLDTSQVIRWTRIQIDEMYLGTVRQQWNRSQSRSLWPLSWGCYIQIMGTL